MDITVIIPTHNPHPERLRRALAALRAQTLTANQWECLLVDNASSPALKFEEWAPSAPDGFRLLCESTLGLTHARRRGFTEARGNILVLVDDDNVLAPDYLEQVMQLFATRPGLGTAGGKSIPEFETPPASWVREFDGLLACRDLGPAEQIASTLWNAGLRRNDCPPFAPIGAGMALRRVAAQIWLDAPPSRLPDRRGGELTSGGDNDIVLTLLAHGWHAGYFPQLSLTHLIPAARATEDYLARLNHGIQKSWMQVLAKHDANPWPRIPDWSVPLRCARAWFRERAWSGPAAYIRWRGACGQFAGLATI